jgi:hypothetical protein
MLKVLAVAATIFAAAGSCAHAQTDLTAYADANGYIDVQALTCAALAGTWQEDADRLTTWYSGWYNGLGKKHYFNIARSKELEHEVIVYCKSSSGSSNHRSDRCDAQARETSGRFQINSN